MGLRRLEDFLNSDAWIASATDQTRLAPNGGMVYMYQTHAGKIHSGLIPITIWLEPLGSPVVVTDVGSIQTAVLYSFRPHKCFLNL